MPDGKLNPERIVRNVLSNLEKKKPLINASAVGSSVGLVAILERKQLEAVIGSVDSVRDDIREMTLAIIAGLDTDKSGFIDHADFGLTMGALFRLTGENTFPLVEAAEGIATMSKGSE